MSSTDFSPFFEVKLDLFDGPLDLLLHLVKKRELPIEKLSLAAIAEQYLACISNSPFLDLEAAGEYLVIATVLLSIKSSILLNEPAELIPDAEGNLVDPHEELLERLRRLEAIRSAVNELREKPMLGIDVFAGASRLGKIDPEMIPLAQHEAVLLARALRRVLAKHAVSGTTFKISVDPLPVFERMKLVVDILRNQGGPVDFEALIAEPASRGVIVSTFAALLELCRRHAIAVKQVDALGAISVELIAENLSEGLDSLDMLNGNVVNL